jgi:transposase
MNKRRRGKELSMRKVGEIFRLSAECRKTNREIARSCGISHTVVNDYLSRAREAGLSYEEMLKMSEPEVVERLKAGSGSGKTSRPQPDWRKVYEELKKKSVTLTLLWEEYKEAHPEGYQLSQFYEYFGRWKKKLDLSLRQTHRAGEKMFVDYAGQTIPVIEAETGKVRQAQIFVAVLGASNYTFSEASWDQGLASWTGSHIHAFEYFEGVPEIVVPDNLKSGVSKTCRYEPDLNPVYHDMAVHYGTAVIPARVAKPKDKAKVEVGVQVVERWILAALRNRKFFSLHDLNAALGELLEKLNGRPFKKLEGSRKSWFEAIERPALKALPEARYELAEWKKARVNIDYHVELEGHYYSVPYGLVQEEVELRYTARTVEIFFRGKRIASHLRDHRPGRHTTQTEHMPKNHREYLEWSPSRILGWAASLGEATGQIAGEILTRREHPEQGYRSCLGILRLGKLYGRDRLEAASRRALAIGAASYKSIRSILENGLDREAVPEAQPAQTLQHPNLRGQGYYE